MKLFQTRNGWTKLDPERDAEPYGIEMYHDVQYLCIRIPGYTWYDRKNRQQYQAAMIEVYKKVEEDLGGAWEMTQLFRCPVRVK